MVEVLPVSEDEESALVGTSRMVVLTGLPLRTRVGSSCFTDTTEGELEPIGGWGIDRTRDGACEDTCDGAIEGAWDRLWDDAFEGAWDGAFEGV